MPLGRFKVPLVSIAISAFTFFSSKISSASSCRAGSPPVKTIKGAVSLGQRDKIFWTSSLSEYFPPFSPSVPQKSVSQNWQIAFSLSSSLPVQRLQPENLQKIAGRPA